MRKGVNLDWPIHMSSDVYLSAREAADLLGVSVATIYSYVSRGWLRSQEGEDVRRTKKHLYAREDLEALRQRQLLKRSPRTVVEGVLNWGVPTMESAISLIRDGRLYYRGYEATELAESAAFEEVAGLLLEGRLDGGLLSGLFDSPARRTSSPLTEMAVEMARCSESFRERNAEAAAQLIRRLFASGGLSPSPWVHAALILLADHELNASSFTARCIASTGAGLPACISGGLAALSGPKHGGAGRQVFEFLASISEVSHVSKAIEARLDSGEAIPGFGHPLYPAGDPRAAALLAKSRPSPVSEAVRIYMEERHSIKPNVDFALAANAPHADFPQILFALARSVGWCAHALEQYRQDALIRPRAKYVGPTEWRNNPS